MIEYEFVNDILAEQKDFRIYRNPKKEFRFVESQISVPGRKGVVQNILIDETGIDDFQLYKFDLKTPDPFPFFNLNNATLPSGVRSFCDYFALCSYRDVFYILLFELKTIDKLENFGTEAKEAVYQLEAGEQFAKFILATAERCKTGNKKKYRSAKYSIDKCSFPDDNILKCITVSVLKPPMLTNPRKSAASSKVMQKSGTLFNATFNVSDTFVIKEMLDKYTKQKPTHQK